MSDLWYLRSISWCKERCTLQNEVEEQTLIFWSWKLLPFCIIWIEPGFCAFWTMDFFNLSRLEIYFANSCRFYVNPLDIIIDFFFCWYNHCQFQESFKLRKKVTSCHRRSFYSSQWHKNLQASCIELVILVQCHHFPSNQCLAIYYRWFMQANVVTHAHGILIMTHFRLPALIQLHRSTLFPGPPRGGQGALYLWASAS